MRKTALALALAAGLAGCATEVPTREVDLAYVAAVESAAKRQGTQVIWINYPTKYSAPASAPANN